MPAAPISIQQNRTADRPCSAEILPALLTRRSKPPSLQRRRLPPSFQWHRHSCLCSDDLRSNFEVESIHRCNLSNQAGFFQPPSPQKKRRPVFSGTGTPACALTTSRSNFKVESIHRCNPSIQAGFLQPPSPQKKTPPSFRWHRHSCLCSDDLPLKFRSRVHPSLQSFQSSRFPSASLATKKKRRPVASGGGFKSLGWSAYYPPSLPLPEHTNRQHVQ
jgi:hypothetical protein